MSAFIFLPGERVSFTVSDIVGDGEWSLEPGRVKAVLDAFSIGFGGARCCRDGQFLPARS
jgi:hypothetical protein